jgi:hypothetical protein
MDVVFSVISYALKVLWAQGRFLLCQSPMYEAASFKSMAWLGRVVFALSSFILST